MPREPRREVAWFLQQIVADQSSKPIPHCSEVSGANSYRKLLAQGQGCGVAIASRWVQNRRNHQITPPSVLEVNVTESSGWEADPLVDAVGGYAGRLTTILGFVGYADANRVRRIYFDPALTNYVDIPADAVVLIERDPNARLTDPSTIWIDADTPVTRNSAAFAIEELFEGDLVQTHLAVALNDEQRRFPSTIPCGISALACPTTGCFPTPRCTLGTVCNPTPKCEPSTPRCPTPPTMKWCTGGGPC